MKKRAKKSTQSHLRCDFSLRHYEEILDGFKQSGYRWSFFTGSPDQKEKRVYLRHDVDLALERALALSRVEHKKGFRSTYFIRTAAPFYNPFDPAFARIILELSRLGHQLGLHFEGEFARETEILKQVTMLQGYFPVRPVVSLHRPPASVRNKKFKHVISTYAPLFFSETKYLSDSGGKWREGCPCQWLKDSSPQNVQVLTHPIWWGYGEITPVEKLHKWLGEKEKYFKKCLKEDFPKAYAKKSRHENFSRVSRTPGRS